MTLEITATSVPEFAQWLTGRRPLALHWENKALTLSDTTSTWLLRWPRGNVGLLDQVTRAIDSSGRKVWTPNATELIVRLARIESIPTAVNWNWLRCASLAKQLANPLAGSSELLRPRSKPMSPLAQTRLLARDMEQLASSSSRRLVATINSRTAVDTLWRPRQVTGITLDVGLLDTEIAAALAARESAAAILGIDLLDDNTKDAAERIHRWLHGNGIRILDNAGTPTLDSSAYPHASLADTTIARATFEEFRRVRRIGSQLWKLLELRRANQDGAVFPRINVHGARTGRGSITKPSLGNINRGLRGLLTARHGFSLVGGDLHAAEPSVAAILSGDAALARDLRTTDVYTTLAARITTSEISDEVRAAVKTCFLGILYGRGAASVARQLGTTTESASELITSIRSRYADLTDWSKSLILDARQGLPLIYPDGRALPTLDAHEAYKAVNYMIQGHASKIFYRMVANVAAELGADALYLPVHDELVLEVPRLEANTAVTTLGRRMYLSEADVTISASPSLIGRAWSK